MRIVTSTILALAVGLASTAALAEASVSTSALVSGNDSAASCASASRQVTEALGSNASDAARQEKKMGLEFCNAGYYGKGVAHYAKAMELVGQKLAGI
jgi:hypothetical protein